jgi:hypothetical protein
MRRNELIFLISLVALSVAVRVAVLDRAQWITEGDEALTGVMALQILDGERPVFLNGQSYMGTYQAYAAAALFAVFGASAVALKVVPLVGSVAFVLATYALARRLTSPAGARAAGLVAAVPPMYVLTNMSKAWAPHAEVMALGNVLILLAIRQHWHEARRVEPLIFGALAGFAFWLHPFVAYYLAVCGVIILLGQPRQTLFRLPAVAAGIVVGTMPVWMVDAVSASETLRYLAVPSGNRQDTGAIVSYLLNSGLPRIFGWWQPWGAPLHSAASVPAALTVAGLLIYLVRGRRVHGFRLAPTDAPLLLAMSVPIMFVLSGFGGPSQNPWGFDATGRYLLPLWVVVPLAVAALAHLASLGRVSATLVACLVIAAHGFGYSAANPVQAFQSPYWGKLPPQSDALEEYLLEQGLDRVWMNHWAGFPLMLNTQGRVIAADYYDVVKGGGINRFPEHFGAMEEAERTAYVLVTNEPAPPLLDDLQELGVEYHADRFGPYLLVQPLSRVVKPWEVSDSLGYEY